MTTQHRSGNFHSANTTIAHHYLRMDKYVRDNILRGKPRMQSKKRNNKL